MAEPLPRDSEPADIIRSLLSGYNSNTVNVNDGPLSAYVAQQRKRDPLYGDEGPSTNVGLQWNQKIGHLFGLPFSGSAGVEAGHMPGVGHNITPRAGLSLGPLMLGAAMDYSQMGSESSQKPSFSGGLHLPVGKDGYASLSGSITPRDMQSYLMELGYNIDKRSKIAALIRHTRPHDTSQRPDTSFGVGYTWR